MLPPARPPHPPQLGLGGRAAPTRATLGHTRPSSLPTAGPQPSPAAQLHREPAKGQRKAGGASETGPRLPDSRPRAARCPGACASRPRGNQSEKPCPGPTLNPGHAYHCRPERELLVLEPDQHPHLKRARLWIRKDRGDVSEPRPPANAATCSRERATPGEAASGSSRPPQRNCEGPAGAGQEEADEAGRGRGGGAAPGGLRGRSPRPCPLCSTCDAFQSHPDWTATPHACRSSPRPRPRVLPMHQADSWGRRPLL